jgi:hypothetical protein
VIILEVVEGQGEVLARDFDALILGWNEHETPIVVTPCSSLARVDYDVLFKTA